MPYTQQHKQATRERIVDTARALFNRRGFVEVSIDEIMAAAGLTRGGFYNHFDSKEALFVEAVRSYGRCNPTERWDDVSVDPQARGSELARQIVEAYLSRSHLQDVEGQCPLIALPSDVARATAGVKQAYRELFEGMARVFGNGLDGTARASERGLALAAMCVGAMVVARSFADAEFAGEVREAARRFALETFQFDGAVMAGESN